MPGLADRSSTLRGVGGALTVLAAALLAGQLNPALSFVLLALASALLLAGPRRLAHLTLLLSPLLILVPQNSAWRWFDLVIVLLGCAAFVSTLQSDDRRAWEIHGGGRLAFFMLLTPLLALPVVMVQSHWYGEYKLLGLGFLLFFSLRRLATTNTADQLLLAFPLAGVLIAQQLAVRVGGVGGLAVTRITFRSFYTNLGWGAANYVAGVLVLTIGVSAILLFRAGNPWLRLLALVALVLQIPSFILLQSRGATLALGFLGLSLLLHAGARARIVLALLGLAAAPVVVGQIGVQALIERFTDPEGLASWLDRMRLWQISWERFLGNPWTGIGLGQGPYQPDLGGRDRAHNYMLQALQDQGVFGFVVWIAWTAAVVILAMRVRPPGDTMFDRLYAGAVRGTVFAVLLHGLVESTFVGYEMCGFLIVFLAWLALAGDRQALDR